MQNVTPDEMAEALRLTRAGRLVDATAFIQRILAGPATRAPTSDTSADPAERIEVTVRAAGRQSSPSVALPMPPAAPTPAPVHSVPRPGGRFDEASYSGAAGTRTYRLYVPVGYAGQPVSLVVMLHGCTQSAADIAAGTRLNELAEQETFLVAYPEQAATANPSRCWNWFKRSHQQRGRGEPSLIAGITRQVMAAHRVDPGRVYVAGMSAGGAMASIMGAAYPELYAAVGVHSGLAYGAARDLKSALTAMRQGGPAADRVGDLHAEGGPPTIAFHGDRDTTVHPRNAERVLARSLPRPPGYVQETTLDDVPPPGASDGRAPGGHAYTRTVYRDALGRVIGERWIVHGAGHTWSGGSPAGSFTDPRGPDASREMLRFFREHPGDGPAPRPAEGP